MSKSLRKSIIAAALSMACGLTYAQAPTEGEEIDLGLSVNWRGYNIGASAPEETGTLYAYASTKAGGYSMQYSYPFFDNMTWTYKFPEGSVSGNPKYDAAALDSDGRWRQATKEQWEELIAGCDIVTYKLNGVDGSLLTSKVNGNSIFLPAYKPSCSYYTSETNGSLPYVASFPNNGYFYVAPSVEVMTTNMSTGPWYGLPLRPVCDRYVGPALEAIVIYGTHDMFVGTSAQLSVASVPEGVPMSLKFASSDESILTVTAKGLVQAPYGSKGGKATITVESGSVTASIDIVVTAVVTDFDEPIVDLGLSVDWCSYNLGAKDYKDIGATYPFAYVTPVELSNAFSDKFYHNGAYSFPEVEFSGNKAYDAIAAAAEGEYAGSRLPSRAEFNELLENCEPHYIFTGEESAPESRMLVFVSKINGKAVGFPLASATGVYYSGSTNVDKSEAYAMFLYSPEAKGEVDEVSSPWKSYPLRGVVEHSTTPSLSAISLNLSEATVYVENTVQLEASAQPVGADIDDLKWVSSDEEVAVVSASGLVTGVGEGAAVISAVCGDVSASATITVKAVNLAQGETVDMGTGLLWGTREVNAVSQTENGDFYMFGNLTPMKAATSYQSSWVEPDVDVIAGTAFDPAHAVLGGNWRMPTRDELLALGSNCEMEWITCGGRRGVLFTSATNGNRIFSPLPAGTTYIFYMGDCMRWGNSSDGSPTVEGLYIAPTQAAINSVRAWRACPILPVYDPTLGIEGIEEESDKVVGIYTLDGRSIPTDTALTSGIYIIRYASGKTAKQAVK